MTKFELISSVVLLVAFIVAIILMLYISWRIALRCVRKDVAKDNDAKIDRLAEQKYQQMLAHTRYRVRQGLRIIDEMK